MDHKLTKYGIKTNGNIKLRIALISDLHDRPYDSIVDTVLRERPDMIALPGDITNNRLSDGCSVLFPLLKACVSIAPTYYSYGNHENRFTAADDNEIIKTGAVLLENSYIRDGGLVIGGFTSGYVSNRRSGSDEHADVPESGWLDRYSEEEGYKILLCHHPEYYPGILKNRDINLILSGHAHGGQIRLFGHGLYAPGQGMFPRYTSGIYEGRMVVSRGLSNTGGLVPRLFNPTEIVIVDLN